jgi:transcriptional regulator with XRE-family HTH domain
MSLVKIVPERGLLIGQREKLGLTQEEVAQKAGITLKQYQKFEGHDRNLSSSSFRIVHAVLSALELDITAFNNGDYVFEPIAEDSPIHQLLAQCDGCEA